MQWAFVHGGRGGFLNFEHLTDTRFNRILSVPCDFNANTSAFTFTGLLYPGVYKVTLDRQASAATNLPSWSTVVVERLAVP